MRFILLDTDSGFVNSLSQRCSKAGVTLLSFDTANAAMAEIKKAVREVDLILISRELGSTQDGLKFAESIRSNSMTADIPYILISSTWVKADFAKHQKTKAGANAYFSKKSSLTALNDTIYAVIGFDLNANAGSATANLERPTGSLSSSGLQNVKLLPANDVLNVEARSTMEIEQESPIKLFDDVPEEAVSATPPAEPSPEIVSSPSSGLTMPAMQVPSPTTPSPEIAAPENIAPASSAAPVGTSLDIGIGIELSSDNQSFELEVSKKESNAPAPTAEPVPPLVQVQESVPVAAPVLENPLELASPVLAIDPPAEVPEAQGVSVSEEEAAKDLPYLFSGPTSGTHTMTRGSASFQNQVTNLERSSSSSSPGSSDDVETLKKYLAMREQDVALLSAQMSYTREELVKSEDTIKRLTLQNEDLEHQINDLKQRVSEQDQELQHADKSLQGEVEQLRFEVKSKIDRIKLLDEKLNDSAEQYEKLKERVRVDIRKIRVREKELESKLEILKKDSETLIAARENKILELKRKIDLLEFNYDTLQDKNEFEKANVAKGKEKITRIHKVLKLALGIIEADEEQTETTKNDKVA